ncbi:hypothetical protein DRQ20_03170 [bacterium]|nr:MAG: hypothetical protein DRQ20_03170 [bacterium]
MLFLFFYNLSWADTLDRGGDDGWREISWHEGGYVVAAGYTYTGSERDGVVRWYSPSGDVPATAILGPGTDNAFCDVACGGHFTVAVGYTSPGTGIDAWIVGFESPGVEVWSDTINLGDADYARAVAIREGNIYVFGDYQRPLSSSTNYFLAVYDTTGARISIDTFNVAYYDYAEAIAISSSWIYLGGYSYIDGDYDWILITLDPSGEIVDIDTFDWGGYDELYDLVISPDGKIYMTGYATIGFYERMMLVKCDSTGEILLCDTILRGGGGRGFAISLDDSGYVYATGYFSSPDGDHILWMKSTSSLEIVWEDTLFYGTDDCGYGIVGDPYGNVYVAGDGYANTHDALLFKLSLPGGVRCTSYHEKIFLFHKEGEFYTPDGRKIKGEPPPGIYFVKEGKTLRKIMVLR